jgi:uncharacterized RDD family membrane protein YckC
MKEPSKDLQTPALYRRLAAFVYEGVLLFGVLMSAGLLYAGLTQMRDWVPSTWAWPLFLLVVLAAYFSWFWVHGGQTVAMRAWHIRLVGVTGSAVSPQRALARFALAWIWFLPALGIARIAGVKSGSGLGLLVFAGVGAYAILSLRLPEKQFWHDIVCGTRLIHSPPVRAGDT